MTDGVDADHPSAPIWPLIAEYNQRLMLKEMGYRFDASTLTDFKVGVFWIISQQYHALAKAQRGQKDP